MLSGRRLGICIGLRPRVGDSGAARRSLQHPCRHRGDGVAESHDGADQPAAHAEKQSAQRAAGQLQRGIPPLVRRLSPAHRVVGHDLLDRALTGDVEETAARGQQHVRREQGAEGESIGESQQCLSLIHI